jgi:hypothetical protein
VQLKSVIETLLGEYKKKVIALSSPYLCALSESLKHLHIGQDTAFSQWQRDNNSEQQIHGRGLQFPEIT